MSPGCREAGVRSLKQLLEKTYRKVALKLVRGGLSGPTPRNDQADPAQPGDSVSEHGGVGLGDGDAPSQPPPDSATSGITTVTLPLMLLLSLLLLLTVLLVCANNPSTVKHPLCNCCFMFVCLMRSDA